jgi:hypothetical protein
LFDQLLIRYQRLAIEVREQESEDRAHVLDQIRVSEPGEQSRQREDVTKLLRRCPMTWSQIIIRVGPL